MAASFAFTIFVAVLGALLMWTGKPVKGGWQRVIGALVLGTGILMTVGLFIALISFAGSWSSN